jgi:predicted RNase H-like HicB family nuclease
MLFAIALFTTDDGTLRAIAPDLAHCDLTGTTEQELLPKLRLAIEGELTRLLLVGKPLPDSRNGEPLTGFSPTELAGVPARWLNVHINVGHLEALARHQAGR